MTTRATNSRDGKHRVTFRLEFRLGEDELAAAVALNEQFDPEHHYAYGSDWVRVAVEQEIYLHGMFMAQRWDDLKVDEDDPEARYGAALALVRRAYKFPTEGDGSK